LLLVYRVVVEEVRRAGEQQPLADRVHSLCTKRVKLLARAVADNFLDNERKVLDKLVVEPVLGDDSTFVVLYTDEGLDAWQFKGQTHRAVVDEPAVLERQVLLGALDSAVLKDGQVLEEFDEGLLLFDQVLVGS